MDSYALLEKLSNAPGVAGFEEPVREAIAETVRPFVDEMRVDTLGNLIATRRGKTAFTLMLDAHMDEIGFMVQHIDAQGFIGFTPLGGWDPRLLPSHLLTILTRDGKRIEGVVGTQPPHILKPADREKVIQIEDMFLDVGATSREEVRKMGVRIGDPVVVHYPFRRIGKEMVLGKALDDRAGCGVIIRTLEALDGIDLDATIVAAFVIGEERGMIGARTAAYQIEPDLAIALEGTPAADIPGVPPQRCPSALGKGPAITVADNSFIAPRKVVCALESAAERAGVPYQYKTPTYGSTDAGAIHQSRGGVLTGVVSVPCRYIHSPFSTCRLSDFDDTWRLLAAFCKEATTIAR
jgi:tetrahedral aminopeptidase